MPAHPISSHQERQAGEGFLTVSFPDLPFEVPISGGDMPGDKVLIGPSHLAKAQALFPRLLALLGPRLDRHERTVLSVHGGSGVGKSEVGALLGYYLNQRGIGTYVLSGDNYPHRIPQDNDHQRILIYREWGLKGLVASGDYTRERQELLKQWQVENRDPDPGLVGEHPWMEAYQTAGRRGLEGYLGSPAEIDFDEVNGILAAFHSGASRLWLKRMGREASDLWYDRIDLADTKVVVLEWTHGNSRFLRGVNLPILLYSTPEETLEHRRKRNRDGGVDSPFTTLVLQVEQQQILAQVHAAQIIVKNDASLGSV